MLNDLGVNKSNHQRGSQVPFLGTEPPETMAIKRKASFIVYTAAGLGFLLIFASAASRRYRLLRAEERCGEGDLAACQQVCQRGAASACERLDEACRAGDAKACGHRQRRRYRRRAQW